MTRDTNTDDLMKSCTCDADTGNDQLVKGSLSVLTKSGMSGSVDLKRLDQDQAVYFKAQIQEARDNDIDPFAIGGEPDEQFMQQLDAIAKGQKLTSSEQVDTTSTTIIDQQTDLSEYQPGEMVVTALGQSAEVIVDPITNTPLLAVPDAKTGFPMSQELANDEQASSRILEESTITGMDYLTAEEKLLVFEAFNDAIRLGGKDAPSATLNLTDGVNPVGGERESYLILRTFLTTLKGGTT